MTGWKTRMRGKAARDARPQVLIQEMRSLSVKPRFATVTKEVMKTGRMRLLVTFVGIIAAGIGIIGYAFNAFGFPFP